MRIYLSLVLLLAFGAQAGAVDHTDPGTSLQFPEQILGWSQTEFNQYDDPYLGFSVGYKGPSNHTITLYVYPGVYTSVPSGGAGTVMEREMAKVQDSVTVAWEQRGGTVKPLLKPTSLVIGSDKTSFALIAAQSIDYDGKPNVSITGVTGYRRNVFKLRYTFPGTAPEQGYQALTDFILAFLKINRDRIDPFFAPCLDKLAVK